MEFMEMAYIRFYPIDKTIVRRLKVKFRKCDNQILSKCGPSTRDENE